MVNSVNDKNFKEEVYDANIPVVVDFWAPWCGPCNMLSPVMEDLSNNFQGKIKFVKVNVDENQETSSKFEVFSIPTVLVFKEGKIVDKMVGFSPKNIIEEKLKKL